MQSVYVNSSIYIYFDENDNQEDPKFKVGDHYEYKNLKIFLLKGTFQIALKNFLSL